MEKQIIKTINPIEIIQKESTGGKNYLVIKTEEGENYRVWESAIFGYFQKEKSIKVKLRVNNKGFNNIVEVVGKAPDRSKENEGSQNRFQGEREKGQARGACFNKSCDIAIAMYQKGGIKKDDIVPQIKKTFHQLLKVLD